MFRPASDGPRVSMLSCLFVDKGLYYDFFELGLVAVCRDVVDFSNELSTPKDIAAPFSNAMH